MKLIPSIETQTQRENASLKLELEQAHAEIARLKAEALENARRPLERRELHRQDSVLPRIIASSSTPSASFAPSYSRPTAAFRNRNPPVIEPPTLKIHPKAKASNDSIQYLDGRIAEKESVEMAGYLRHTHASSEKTSAPYNARADGITYTSAMRQVSFQEFQDEPESPPEDSFDVSGYNFELDRRVDAGDGYHDTEAMDQVTRLRDDTFYSTQPGRAYIPFAEQWRLMNEVYCLAQESLYEACRRHWPEAWRSYYRHGPRTVRFGFTELQTTVCRSSCGRYAGEICTTPACPSAIFMVIPLRNAICHPSAQTAHSVDHLFEDAQHLACKLTDEKRARQIRALRDEMQQIAAETYQEIVDYEPLCHLPEARPWAIHHQEFFSREVGNGLDESDEQLIETSGAAAVRAANEWRLQQDDPGEDDPVYLASIEAQQAKYRAVAAQMATEPEWANPVEPGQNEVPERAFSPWPEIGDEDLANVDTGGW